MATNGLSLGVNSFGESLCQPLAICWEPHQLLFDIHTALCSLKINGDGEDCLVQVWLLTLFGEVGSLQTSRVPFAIRDSNGHLRSFREASVKHNFLKGKVFSECTGFPGRVIFRGLAQCIENVQNYAKQLNPQKDDVVNCGVRGCLYLPMFQNEYPVGVIELSMLVPKQSFPYEWGEIYTAFKAVNLDVPVPTLHDNKKKGKWKLDKLIPEVIEPYFYKMKLEDAANKFGGKSTIRKATRNARYREWPPVDKLKQEANPQPEGMVNPTNSAGGCVHEVSTFAELVTEQTNCFPRTTRSSTCPSLGTGSWEAGTSSPMYHGVNPGDLSWDSKVDAVSTEDNTSLSINDYLVESVDEPIECCQPSDMAGSSEVTTCTPEGRSSKDLNFNYLEDEDMLIYDDSFFWKCDDPFPGV